MLLQRILRSGNSSWRPLSECAICPRPSHASIIRQRRHVHEMPQLTYHNDFSEYGVKGLLSKDAYNIAWTQYEALMIRKLNSITAGFEAEHSSTIQLALQYARNPATASLFNHASMAHNNDFFFQALSPAPLPLKGFAGLKASLEQTYGSIDTLRQTMLATADAMFGPGFVWLVSTRSDAGARSFTWKILTTYLAGTPYAEAGYRQQDKDMNVQNTVSSFGPASRFGKMESAMPPGAARVEPVLCVNTWEHVYLSDFGVGGKTEYLEKWWDSVNWGTVDGRVPATVKELWDRPAGYVR